MSLVSKGTEGDTFRVAKGLSGTTWSSTTFMTCHFKVSTCHAEFHENILIEVFILLQKIHSFLYFENLYVKEGLCVWDAEEPNLSCLRWDFLF